MCVVKIGGPAYRIGVGGGAASSMCAGENLSNFGMLSSLFWGLFGVMGVYDIAMGISPSTAPNFISTGANFVFCTLFFLNSRKS